MTLLLHGGLKNDTNTETFELRTRNSSGVVRRSVSESV